MLADKLALDWYSAEVSIVCTIGNMYAQYSLDKYAVYYTYTVLAGGMNSRADMEFGTNCTQIQIQNKFCYPKTHKL